MHWKNVIRASMYIRDYPMLIRCIVDAEMGVGMKNLSPKEAITILEGMRIDIPVPKAAVMQTKRNVALDMAIDALKCSEIPNGSDSISRQAAIETIFSEPLYESGMKKRDADAVVPAIYEKIKSLPSAQPERKTGRWIRVGERCGEPIWQCSECKVEEAVPTATSFITGIAYAQWNYCPN